MVNIIDIAKKTGLSIATVSKVVNNDNTVKSHNRELVQKAVQELGYKPNKLAVSLSKGNTRNIGIIVPDISTPFFSEMVRGITDFFDRQGYYAFICSSDNRPQKEEVFINDFISMWLDGVILAPSETESRDIEKLNLINLPMVLVDREIEGLKKDLVIINNNKGAYEAVLYLINKGHKKIPIVGGLKFTKTAINRCLGWKKAMMENNLFDEKLIFWGDFSIESGYKIMKEIFQELGTVDAIFAANDVIALGVIQSIYDEGLRIPQDISIIGFDDIYFSKFLNPPLTTIKQPIYMMGELAAEILLRYIKEKNHKLNTERYIIEGELIERNSVKVKDL